MPPHDDVGAGRSPWRGVRQRAAELGIGPRSLYRAIQRGDLRAAPVNQRGDLLIHDDWIREWLEAKAKTVSPLRKVVG
jgi:hypothetical protein